MPIRRSGGGGQPASSSQSLSRRDRPIAPTTRAAGRSVVRSSGSPVAVYRAPVTRSGANVKPRARARTSRTLGRASVRDRMWVSRKVRLELRISSGVGTFRTPSRYISTAPSPDSTAPASIISWENPGNQRSSWTRPLSRSTWTCAACGTPGRTPVASGSSRSTTTTSVAWSQRTRAASRPAMLPPSTTARPSTTLVPAGGCAAPSSRKRRIGLTVVLRQLSRGRSGGGWARFAGDTAEVPDAIGRPVWRDAGRPPGRHPGQTGFGESEVTEEGRDMCAFACRGRGDDGAVDAHDAFGLPRARLRARVRDDEVATRGQCRTDHRHDLLRTVGVGEELQDRGEQHADGTIQVDDPGDRRMAQDSAGIAQVGLDHGDALVHGEERLPVGDDDRIVVHVDDAGLRVVLLGDLVDVLGGRQTAADVDELGDATLADEVTDGPQTEPAVLDDDLPDARIGGERLSRAVTVHLEVVLAAKQAVDDAGDRRDGERDHWLEAVDRIVGGWRLVPHVRRRSTAGGAADAVGMGKHAKLIRFGTHPRHPYMHRVRYGIFEYGRPGRNVRDRPRRHWNHYDCRANSPLGYKDGRCG